MRRIVAGLASAASVVLAVAGIAWTHRFMGGDLRLFLQPEALAVVLGGTAVALFISFPSRVRSGAISGAFDLARRRTPPADDLVPVFIALAYTARRQGWGAIEGEIARMKDPFLARALTLSISGMTPELVRETLETESKVTTERDEEHALVFDTAAKYAPTLGMLGGLLGLMRAVELTSWSAGMPHGLAGALAAIVFGVALASLVCQPVAVRMRARARVNARCRDLTIRGVLALRDGAAPSVVEDRLAGFLQKGKSSLAVVA
jgi:chemotaxis protein MotA